MRSLRAGSALIAFVDWLAHNFHAVGESKKNEPFGPKTNVMPVIALPSMDVLKLMCRDRKSEVAPAPQRWWPGEPSTRMRCLWRP